jgi:hypothetical protein
MPRGGKREGAGRKPKREKYSGAINKAEKRIADKLPELIGNMFELAAGVTISEPDDNASDGSGKRIYTRPPDRQANEYLINRILGKPTERQEVSGEDGGPLKIVVEYGLDSDDSVAAAPPSAAPNPEGSEAV